MTTQATVYGDFTSDSGRDAVILQFQEDVVDADLLPPPGGAALAALAQDLASAQLASAQLYKGGSDQWFITYELGLDDREDGGCPQVTRVYLSGELRGWELGSFTTRSGSMVHGVKIEYERTHERCRPREDSCEYPTAARCFAKFIELPAGATEVALRSALPDRYRHALHRF